MTKQADKRRYLPVKLTGEIYTCPLFFLYYYFLFLTFLYIPEEGVTFTAGPCKATSGMEGPIGNTTWLPDTRDYHKNKLSPTYIAGGIA